MFEISEQDILKILEQDNPWWISKRASAFQDFSIRRTYLDPFAELALNWDVKRSIILMGPRRVGKTVILQQLIGTALDSDFPPEKIFFASIDTPLYSQMALEKLLQLYEKKVSHDKDSKRLVIFDEIQYLRDWEVHLKVLTDKYPKTRFIASGSAAAALNLKSKESGAGRFTDFFLPPLTFAEFLKFRNLEGKLIVQKGNSYDTTDINGLNDEFINYLNFGGYPEAVLNANIRQNVQRFLGRDIIDKVLLRDLPQLYGIQDIQELNKLFTNIAYHSGSEISLEELARSSGIAKNTINKYLEYLEAAFLIVIVNRIDGASKKFKKRMRFKAYLTNPSMRAALFSPLSSEDQAIGTMVETAIFSQWFHSPTLKDIHYARWRKGRKDLEVDLIKIRPSDFKPFWAYEIKWSDNFTGENSKKLTGLIEFAGQHNIPAGATSKTITDETTIKGVTIKHFPCALHCYQVGKRITERGEL